MIWPFFAFLWMQKIKLQFLIPVLEIFKLKFDHSKYPSVLLRYLIKITLLFCPFSIIYCKFWPFDAFGNPGEEGGVNKKGEKPSRKKLRKKMKFAIFFSQPSRWYQIDISVSTSMKLFFDPFEKFEQKIELTKSEKNVIVF